MTIRFVNMYSCFDAAIYIQTNRGSRKSPAGDSFARVGDKENCHGPHRKSLIAIVLAEIDRHRPVIDLWFVHLLSNFFTPFLIMRSIKIAKIRLFLIMCVVRKLKSPFVVTSLEKCDAMDHLLAPRIMTVFP